MFGGGDEDLKFEDSERNYSPKLTTEYLLADDRAFFHLLCLIMKEFQYVSGRKLEFEARVYPTYGRGLVMLLG